MGTLVLIALGIVFWPLIVTAPDVRDPIVLAPMPEAPLIDRTPINAPESYQDEVEVQLPNAPTVPVAEQSAADDGTFIDENATIRFDVPPADEVVMAASSLAKPDDETLFRVQIGPNAERERLQRFRPQIDKALGVESEILRYTQ